MEAQIQIIVILSIILGIILLADRIESLFVKLVHSPSQFDRVVRKLAILPKKMDNGEIIFCEFYYAKEMYHIDSEMLSGSEWKTLFAAKYYDQLPLLIIRK